MLKQTQALLGGTLVGLLLSLAGDDARAQFQPPANSLMVEEEGKLEGMQGAVLAFRDSKQELWLLQVAPQSKVTIAGEAKLPYLRQGMTVELTAKIDEEAAIADPIAEIDVINGKGRLTMGLFDPADGEDAKAVRNPEPGEYRVRGRLTSVKDGALEITAGRLKLTGKAADDLKVILAVDDPSLAKAGDAMKVKIWHLDGGKPNPTLQQPGRALAEEVSITLSEPPVANKRGR
jgi:hypothetical protein